MIEDELTARLLRLGGMRPDVPADRERRVRQAFFEEVRARARARIVRRRAMIVTTGLTMAAVIVLALRVWPAREVSLPPAEVIGAVERVDGDPQRLGEVRTGDRIQSSDVGRIALRLTNGVSLRLDRASRVQLASVNHVTLDAGAVYVDSGSESPGLEIATPLGAVRDIGTQFEVRLDDSSLRVRVRSGVVEVHRGTDVSSARPGTELTVTSAQTMTRAVASHGEEWAWAADLAPTFAIEGRSLSAFLEYVCREQGWTLVYGDSKLAVDASGMILHGSTQGLSPSNALAVVVATTGLTHRITGGELHIARVGRSPAPRKGVPYSR